MRKPSNDRMQAYWDERARVNPAWYVDTSLDFDEPDMDLFFENGQRIVDHVVDGLPSPPQRRDVALEIGAGLGRLCKALSKSYRHVIGVDISPTMVERAKSLVPECEFRVNDGSSLAGIDDESVDFVLTFTVFQHIPEPDVIHGYVDEIGRVLAPGGAAYLQWNGSSRSLPKLLRQRLGAALYRGGLRRSARETDAPEFQGSSVSPTVMTGWLNGNGLDVVRTDALGGLWAQAWVTKPDRPA
jgi:SAM-dependent methyltransferase